MHQARILTLFVAAWLSLTASILLAESSDHSSGLADAAEQNDTELFEQLLKSGAEVDAPQADGTRAIHWTSYHGNAGITQMLIAAGADVNAANEFGMRPLHLGCINGDGDIVAALLKAGADANAANGADATPLILAARTGKLKPVQTLIQHDIELEASLTNGQTALMFAAAEGHLDVVQALLEAGAEFNKSLKSGFTPFLFAVRGGHLDIVRFFLQQGVDVNAVMETDRTGGKRVRGGTAPLMLAVENAHFEVAAELLKAGADPNDQRSGFTPLHALTWVRKPNSGDGDDGDPPPQISGMMTSLQFVYLLVEHGAEVNTQLNRGRSGRGRLSHKGATAFLMAADTADLPLMKTLIELGADPSIPNADGANALMAAAGLGTTAPTEEAGTEPEALAAVQYLLTLEPASISDAAHTPWINKVDANGETAMHGAAYANFPAMVELLDRSGADVRIWHQTNKYGWTPLIIAQGFRPGNFKPAQSTIDAIEKVLRSHGIDPPPAPSRNPTEDDRYKKKK